MDDNNCIYSNNKICIISHIYNKFFSMLNYRCFNNCFHKYLKDFKNYVII